jgi:hypothetical protein
MEVRSHYQKICSAETLTKVKAVLANVVKKESKLYSKDFQWQEKQVQLQ